MIESFITSEDGIKLDYDILPFAPLLGAPYIHGHEWSGVESNLSVRKYVNGMMDGMDGWMDVMTR